MFDNFFREDTWET